MSIAVRISRLLRQTAAAVVIAALPNAGHAALSPGASFQSFFWTADANGSIKKGCYGYIKIASADSTSTGISYASNLWLPNYSWWHSLFLKTYLTTAIKVSKKQPAAISRAPGHFADNSWLEGFERTDSSGHAMRFLFPTLPASIKYGRYDYFTVNVNDTLNLEFYGAGDSIMAGTFVDKRPAANGAVNIIARNAFIVELTESNPLRIKSIRCNGTFEPLISGYLGYPLTKFWSTAAWYGIDIIDTSAAPQISIHSIMLKGDPPLTAASTYPVSWKLDGDSIVDSCLISFSYDSAKTWSLAGKTRVGSSFIWTVPNRTTSNAFIRITACGKNGVHVSSQSPRFSTILPAEYKLKITSLSTSGIIASWNPPALTTPLKKALYIAWRNGSIVRTMSEKNYDSIGYDFTIDRDTITGLNTTGIYYFSAFVLDSAGNFTLAGPGAIDSAFAEDHTPPLNNTILSGTGLDSTRVIISWQYSGKRDVDIDSVALRYNSFRFPLSVYDSLSQSVTLQSSADSLDTITGLKPATTWYFAMFVADSSGNWSAASEQSRIQIRTSTGFITTKASVNNVKISTADTQSVFSGAIRIWSTTLKVPYVDTIDPWTPPSLAGFVGAAPAFSFRYGMLPAGATVTMAIKPGKLPDTYSIADLQVYRYNIFTGGWRLEEGAVSIGPDSTAIIVTTADTRLPFILMIDTIPPEIGPRHADTAVYRVTRPVIDTLFVSDNIENFSVKLLAGPGSLGYSDITLYAEPGREKGTYITTIPAYVADMHSGLRGLFIISDGRNGDSVNLSRRILRENSKIDDVITSPMTWTPLYATAQPFDSLLANLRTKADGGTWNYDTDNERIYQLLPTASPNPSDTNVWTEYTDNISADFTFAPGKLFWIKSRFATPVDFGDAVIPSLADTFEIPLRHNDWTDFSLPYRFNIYSGDLLAATATKHTGIEDSIELYHWEKSDTTYRTEALYLPGIKEKSGDTITIPAAQPFAVYNASHQDIVLRIPPVSTPMSTYGKHAGSLKKAAADNTWSIKITLSERSGNRLPSMYIGSTPQNGKYRYYPMPPAFNDVSAGIVDETTGRRYGSAARGDLAQGGATYRIAFENSSSAPKTIISTIASRSGLPQGIKAHLFRNDDYRTSPSTDTSEIALPPHSKITGYLALGTDDYIKKVVRNLTSKLSFLPYTCSGALALRYTLPPDVRNLTISIFDLKGRRVDQLRKTTGLGAGPGQMMWRSLRPPGYYIIQMNVAIDGKAAPLIMNKRWLYVR